ncbi:MAG: transporter [Sinimarinibacterium flocculans]|uniref:transporter n=1 Tax=Sinimarinibacterium flocculans TaxID=985250 RepID=UPI003AEDA401
MSRRLESLIAFVAVLLPSTAAWAHDPIFGLGPHTLYKGGVEVHGGFLRKKAGDERENEYALALKYGLTGDWVIGIEAPFIDLSSPGSSVSGRGDVALSTKYRFWRNDLPGVQEGAAVSLAGVFDTADEAELGGGATDVIAGLSYGYEGRKWYRWGALRYRRNGTDDTGLDRGDKLLLDLVGGIRFKPTGYLAPDWVWMLELNGEYAQRAERDGVKLANTGGTQWFVSPGLMWTYRNFAIKTGVQIPVIRNLNGNQDETDYRAALEFELHL